MLIENQYYPDILLFAFYSLAPLAVGFGVGWLQRRLFLNRNPPAARWWLEVTCMGLACNGLMYLCSVVLSNWVSDMPDWLGMAMGIAFLPNLLSIYLAGNAVLTGLLQFFLLRETEFRWRYLVFTWINSFVAVLANLGVWAIYETRLNDPAQDPMIWGAKTQMYVQPTMILATIVVYGLGTSLMLRRNRLGNVAPTAQAA